MGSTRKITYASISNTTGATSIYSSAEAWGQLKGENLDIDLKSKGMKAWVKTGTGNEGYALTSNDSRLPEGDFLLYFILEKNDSGAK